MTPVLETERLILRAFTSDDWAAINAVVADPGAVRQMHFATWTEEKRREWFDWCVANTEDRDALNWAVVHKQNGEVIGWFGIGSASHPTTEGERSFGYLLNPTFWNRGYMTEALDAVLEYELGERGTPCVSATCEVANVASSRVMEKAGMRRVKTVSDTDFEGNRARRHHYVITREKFRRFS